MNENWENGDPFWSDLKKNYPSTYRTVVSRVNHLLHQTREETERATAGEIRRQLEMTLLFRDGATMGQEVSEWPEIIRGFIRHFIDKKYLGEQRQRLKGGKV